MFAAVPWRPDTARFMGVVATVDPGPRSRGGPCIITLERGATRRCCTGVEESPTTFPVQTPALSAVAPDLAPDLLVVLGGGGARSRVDGE